MALGVGFSIPLSLMNFLGWLLIAGGLFVPDGSVSLAFGSLNHVRAWYNDFDCLRMTAELDDGFYWQRFFCFGFMYMDFVGLALVLSAHSVTADPKRFRSLGREAKWTDGPWWFTLLACCFGL